MDVDILITGLTILALDMMFLGAFGFGQRFMDMITKIQNKEANIKILPAIFAYIFMVMGQYLIVKPLTQNSWDAIYYGGMFGLVSFGIFDMTNMALIEDYELSVATIDIVWGTALNATTALLVHNYKYVFDYSQDRE